MNSRIRRGAIVVTVLGGLTFGTIGAAMASERGSGGETECFEDGLQHPYLGGLASKTVHRGVEPIAGAIDSKLNSAARPLVHNVNCSLVVPVEGVVDQTVQQVGPQVHVVLTNTEAAVASALH